MSWHDDILEGLPSPSSFDDEPANLRKDILDELADHVECAVQRELRRSDDPATARKSALERFGNPRQIARRLWLDAMKGQLMNQRIMIGTQVLMIIVIGALCATLIASLKQNQHMQEVMVARIEAIAARSPTDSSSAASHEWPRFHLRVVDAGGKGLANLPLTLSGEPYNAGEKLLLNATTDVEGRATIGPMRAGGYNLRIVHKDDSESAAYSRTVAIPPGPDQPELRVEWTDTQPKPVNIPLAVDMPTFDEAVNWMVVMEITSSTGSNSQGMWSWPSKVVAIDKTGRIGVLNLDEYRLASPAPINASDLENVNWTDHVTLDSSRQNSVAKGNFYCATTTSRNSEVQFVCMAEMFLSYGRIDKTADESHPVTLQPNVNSNFADEINRRFRTDAGTASNRH